MSQKREKEIRRVARFMYKCSYGRWMDEKPTSFIGYRKWKKRKPEYKTYEKFVRERYKKERAF